jgi:hypothetical protein
VKVLIVEYEVVSRHLLKSHLQQWGHQVVAAPDGAAAWRLFQEQDFPLILSDWAMPEMDKLELRGRGRRLWDQTGAFTAHFRSLFYDKARRSRYGIGPVGELRFRDHGGSIEVESELGRGTLFRIRLPLRPPHFS